MNGVAGFGRLGNLWTAFLDGIRMILPAAASVHETNGFWTPL